MTLPAEDDVALPADHAATDAGDAAPATSQTERALVGLRALILDGVLTPGRRLVEQQLVERLGVSRTPVRGALARLVDEGLLEAWPGGGHAVRAFSAGDIHDAIEVRGTLEGLAARLAAERGASAVLLAEARRGLAEIDALLAAPVLDAEGFARYVTCNARFHEQLGVMASSTMVLRSLAKARAAPFASPSSFVLTRSEGAAARDMLVVAQAQHRGLLEAIARREGTRAEALAREHARLAQQNLKHVVEGRAGVRAAVAAELIKAG